jgi:hypothetical protein
VTCQSRSNAGIPCSLDRQHNGWHFGYGTYWTFTDAGSPATAPASTHSGGNEAAGTPHAFAGFVPICTKCGCDVLVANDFGGPRKLDTCEAYRAWSATLPASTHVSDGAQVAGQPHDQQDEQHNPERRPAVDADPGVAVSPTAENGGNDQKNDEKGQHCLKLHTSERKSSG